MARSNWNRISDLPDRWEELASEELPNLSSIWREQSKKLENSGALKIFRDRMKREWAIETGIIENLYSIDRGITEALIERGIESALIPHGASDKPAQEVVAVIKDQEQVLDGLFEFINGTRSLSTSYIKEIHSAFTRHQNSVTAKDENGNLFQVELIRGDWKKWPNNPTREDGTIHHYCPPEQVSIEMDHLIKMYSEHQNRNIPPEVEAAWLHHRFVQIHPFQDGNGRVARALASLVFIKHWYFPLVIDRDIRGDYISALEDGDKGNLASLVALFSRQQKSAFIKALSLSHDAIQEHEDSQEKQVITTALEILRKRKREHLEDIKGNLFELTDQLLGVVHDKLKDTANELTNNLKSIDSAYHAFANMSNEANDFYFRRQVIDIAHDLKYYADLRTYRSWARLKIVEERNVEIVFALHGLGYEFTGVMAVSAFIEYKGPSEDGTSILGDPQVVCKELFQYSHLDDRDKIISRFMRWINEATLIGLDNWRRNL